jgi:hypothetical protein
MSPIAALWVSPNTSVTGTFRVESMPLRVTATIPKTTKTSPAMPLRIWPGLTVTRRDTAVDCRCGVSMTSRSL